MGKYGKYLKKYSSTWEKEASLKGWLTSNSEENVLNGQPEAFCKVCQQALRAHHADLLKHTTTAKHLANARKFDRKTQPSLHNYGAVEVSETAKFADLKLAVFIATHCSVNTIDHLGELLNELGAGSPLEKVRCHRTKCSKLIENVIAPTFLKELVDDVGDSPFSLIVDEVTDNSTSKFMGVCVRYFSQGRGRMITDFLGLILVRDCTGAALAAAVVEFLRMEVVKLPLQNLQGVGVDGASNMCGQNNSFYTHLKKQVPHLMLFKCVCHSIDKCAEHAYAKLPADLSDLLDDTNTWFNKSAKKWGEYCDYYKTSTGRNPKKLVSRSKTRWLVWVPCSDVIIDQWFELKGYFTLKGEGPQGDRKAKDLSKLYSESNMLYLLFLRHALSGVQKISSAFEQTDADITKLYTDLRSQVLVLAGRILKPQSMAQAARPGMLRCDEARMLKEALSKSENLLPVDRVNLGDAFRKKAQVSSMPADELYGIRHKCGEYIYVLTRDLLDKLPSNLDAVSKLKYLTPKMALSQLARPGFQQLPTEMAGEGVDLEALESQWVTLGTLSTAEILDDVDAHTQLEDIDTVKFWATVLKLKDAGGEQAFRELALFALKCMSLPISNAVVERIFSVLSCIKCRRRNRLQLSMLEALIRLRVHLKVDGLCCKSFKPTRDMYRRFTADMYKKVGETVKAPQLEAAEEDVDDPEAVEIHISEGDEELEEIDFEIVNELDTVVFNEDLLIVHL